MEATKMAITQTYTANEVFELELDEPFELIDGELHLLPGSGSRSSRISLRIGGRIDVYLENNPIGFATGEDGEYVLSRNPDTMIAPDVGYARFDRVPNGEVPTKFCPTYLDLAVEVNSPSDRNLDASRKVQRYLDAGTSLVWLVDPKSETVVVYRKNGECAQFSRGQTLSGEDVLPGFEISVDVIFK
jgi:Uma2 family endonuclease